MSRRRSAGVKGLPENRKKKRNRTPHITIAFQCSVSRGGFMNVRVVCRWCRPLTQQTVPNKSPLVKLGSVNYCLARLLRALKIFPHNTR